MSAGGGRRSEDQFMCSICLDIFTEPVSTPCGHNFCKTCIGEHWQDDVRCQCPICNEVFYPKPGLRVNTLISELADEFRQADPDINPEQQAQNPQEVPGVLNARSTGKSWIFWAACAILFVIFAYKRQNFLLKSERRGNAVNAEAEIEQMIQASQLKIEEFKLAVERSKKEAQKQIEEGIQAFADLKASVERDHAGLIETIKQRQRTKEAQAEVLVSQLGQFIQELKKRKTEVELFSTSHLEQTLADMIKNEIPNLITRAELKKAQRYAADVTLDPETAHPSLTLSEDGKQVYHGDASKNLPDNPERFSYCVNVLGRQGFSSGKFYFEVLVKGKTDWDLGVAKESINRKGQITLKPQNGYWTIWLRNGGDYKAHAGPAVDLSVATAPEKVGVFVDYEEGLVSFYDVDAAALLYSFTGYSFTERLYPLFSPSLNEDGKNSAPLIITAVKHTV